MCVSCVMPLCQKLGWLGWVGLSRLISRRISFLFSSIPPGVYVCVCVCVCVGKQKEKPTRAVPRTKKKKKKLTAFRSYSPSLTQFSLINSTKRHRSVAVRVCRRCPLLVSRYSGKLGMGV
jgi:hypothetical protein